MRGKQKLILKWTSHNRNRIKAKNCILQMSIGFYKTVESIHKLVNCIMYQSWASWFSRYKPPTEYMRARPMYLICIQATIFFKIVNCKCDQSNVLYNPNCYQFSLHSRLSQSYLHFEFEFYSNSTVDLYF